MKKAFLAAALLLVACRKTESGSTTLLPASPVSAANGCVFCTPVSVAYDTSWHYIGDSTFYLALDTSICYVPDSVLRAYIGHPDTVAVMVGQRFVDWQVRFIYCTRQ